MHGFLLNTNLIFTGYNNHEACHNLHPLVDKGYHERDD